MKHFLLLAAAAVSTPAFAQTEPAPQTEPALQTVEAAPEFDPQHLVAANAVAEKLFPAGTYARTMNDTVERVIRASVSSTRDSQLSELAVMGWLTNEQFSQLSAEAIKEMIGIIDPVSDKRMAMIRQAMSDELTKAMIEAEPEIREGIALSYARRFTPQQLAEINAFLGTPTGSLYAAESLPITTGSEVMGRMMKKMSKLGENIPAMMKTASLAPAKLPKVKLYARLNKAERKRMAELMGLTEAELAERNKPLKNK